MKLPAPTSENGLDLQPFQPVPFEKRASQQLGTLDAVWAMAKFILITKIGAVAGWGLAKALKRPDQAVNLATLGGSMGGLVEGYQHWSKEEAVKVGVDQIYREFQSLHDVRPTNEELAADNQLLRRMVEQQQAMMGQPATGPILDLPNTQSPTTRISGEKEVAALQAASLEASRRT